MKHRSRQGGASAIEFAIAVPVVLMLGLGALQGALVFHARQAIEHATIEAARSGSLSHALPVALETGLARGLLPYWGVLPDLRSQPDRELATLAARVRVRQGLAAGWLVVRRIAPNSDSFVDWAEPSLDEHGRPRAGQLEIPNDNLQHADQRSPAGGAAGMRQGLPVGRRSGQTLLDANLLQVEIVYGVPMTVPLAGRIAALVGRLAAGCRPAEQGGCLIHNAPDAGGRSVPRWPVVVQAAVRMQSPAREMAAASLPPLPPIAVAPGGLGGGTGSGPFFGTPGACATP